MSRESLAAFFGCHDLEKCPKVKAGDKIVCHKCGELHTAKHDEDDEDITVQQIEMCDMLRVECNGSEYTVALDGYLVFGVLPS